MHTPCTGTPSASPKVSAVIRPTRSPVYGPGPDADDDPGDGVELQPRLGEHPVDGRQQQLPVPARVHLAGRGDDGRAVVQGDGDGGGGGIQSEQEHANSLRLPAPGARPPGPAHHLLLPSRQATYSRTRGGHSVPAAARDSWPGSPRRPSPRSASSPTRPRPARPATWPSGQPATSRAAAASKAPRGQGGPDGAARRVRHGRRGSCTRVGDDRVWLVGPATGQPHLQGHAGHGRTRRRAPTRSPPARARSPAPTASPIEHVVRFTTVDGVAVGFSAAVDGSTPQPDPRQEDGRHPRVPRGRRRDVGRSRRSAEGRRRSARAVLEAGPGDSLAARATAPARGTGVLRALGARSPGVPRTLRVAAAAAAWRPRSRRRAGRQQIAHGHPGRRRRTAAAAARHVLGGRHGRLLRLRGRRG